MNILKLPISRRNISKFKHFTDMYPFLNFGTLNNYSISCFLKLHYVYQTFSVYLSNEVLLVKVFGKALAY